MTDQPRTLPNAQDILSHLERELSRTVETEEGDDSHPQSKWELLTRNLVDEALKGDPRMVGHVLKFLDKRAEPTAPVKPNPVVDWHMLFAFYGKYHTLIWQEIERLKQQQPDYWSFDWFRPTPERAPWRKDIPLPANTQSTPPTSS
jgi:hypothetical protein